MTIQEAIRLLKLLRTYHNGTYAKAIDMAIKALKEKQQREDDGR